MLLALTVAVALAVALSRLPSSLLSNAQVEVAKGESSVCLPHEGVFTVRAAGCVAFDQPRHVAASGIVVVVVALIACCCARQLQC